MHPRMCPSFLHSVGHILQLPKAQSIMTIHWVIPIDRAHHGTHHRARNLYSWSVIACGAWLAGERRGSVGFPMFLVALRATKGGRRLYAHSGAYQTFHLSGAPAVADRVAHILALRRIVWLGASREHSRVHVGSRQRGG